MSLPEQRVIPALRITQYERSKAFYLDQLGFELEWEHRFAPHFPVFMSVVCDRMRLYLSEHTDDCQVGGLVHFVVPEVETWHQEFLKRGVSTWTELIGLVFGGAPPKRVRSLLSHSQMLNLIVATYLPVTVPPNYDLSFCQMTLTDPDGNQLRFRDAQENKVPVAIFPIGALLSECTLQRSTFPVLYLDARPLWN